MDTAVIHNRGENYPALLSRVCTLVQHTVVRPFAVSYGRPQNLTQICPKPLDRSKKNFAQLIKCARSRAVPKLIKIGCTGAPRRYAKDNVLVSLFCFFFCLLRFAHAPRTESRTKVNDGSKYVFSLKEVPFSGPVDDHIP